MKKTVASEKAKKRWKVIGCKLSFSCQNLRKPLWSRAQNESFNPSIKRCRMPYVTGLIKVTAYAVIRVEPCSNYASLRESVVRVFLGTFLFCCNIKIRSVLKNGNE